MTDGVVLAIDQGTTNTKALAVDRSGRILAQASVPMQVTYPKPGWAEQSADDIWTSVQTVIADVAANKDSTTNKRIEARVMPTKSLRCVRSSSTSKSTSVIQLLRSPAFMPQGLPLDSMFLNRPLSSLGKSLATMTWLRRMSAM